jgi:hypothetical protein
MHFYDGKCTGALINAALWLVLDFFHVEKPPHTETNHWRVLLSSA